MTDDQDSNPDPQPSAGDPEPVRRGRRRRRRWLFAGGLGVAALAGLFATRAWAHHGGYGRFGRVHSQAELRERLGRGAEFALWRVDATDVQRERVEAILDQNAPALWSTHQKGTAVRTALLDALARGDRSAAENARKQAVTWADEASRTWLSLVEQSLAVLDDAQRAEVRERFADMAAHHHAHP